MLAELHHSAGDSLSGEERCPQIQRDHVVEILHSNFEERHRPIGASVVHQNIERLKTSNDIVEGVKVSDVEGNCIRRPYLN
jgi:hypothetical protein